MGKGEKHLNRMERDETLLLLLSMGMSLEGNVGAGSNTSYVLESTAYPVVTKTFHFYHLLEPVIHPEGQARQSWGYL